MVWLSLISTLSSRIILGLPKGYATRVNRPTRFIHYLNNSDQFFWKSTNFTIATTKTGKKRKFSTDEESPMFLPDVFSSR
ncbi:hypothetical protein BDA99DRAFT_497913 [Phascolomyces articulosus]|uniref:Secreted protein n=1 Tax=Phascolomyces articulosus TaxID=60185 RepID=A0AAD5K8J1_9FUNG|nr:hypothetical protein BDA99DRAFT_497913 [Phascolomyces articulosus]